MGFGMQDWIFKQRPRKPFSKVRKPSVDTIHRDSWNDLNIEGRTSKNIEVARKSKQELLQKIHSRWIRGKIVNILILTSIFSIIILLLIRYKDKYSAGYSAAAVYTHGSF